MRFSSQMLLAHFTLAPVICLYSLGVDGFLSDYEVFEALNSANFAATPEFSDLDSRLHSVTRNIDQLRRNLRNVPGATLPNGRPVRPLSEDQRRHMEAELVHATQQQQRLQRAEDLAWIRSQTLKYLSHAPGSTQSVEHVRGFFTKLAALQKEHRFELMAHEALQLVNLRPTTAIEMHTIVEQFTEVHTCSDIFNASKLFIYGIYSYCDLTLCFSPTSLVS